MDNPETQVVPPARVLVIDDNLNNLHLLTNMLSEHGYAVWPTTEGALAVASAQANPPDLILLDIVMPGTDGYAICAALKTDERTRAVPVIFISALSEPFDKVQAFAVGAVDYITKPFNTEEVLARVAAHVALQRLRRRLEEQNAQLQQESAERRRTEQALHESEERFRLNFDLSPIGAAMGSLDGRYLRVNDMFCQLTGYTRDELLARHFTDITHPDDRERNVESMAALVAEQISEYVTVKRYVRKDGRIAWAKLSALLMKGPDNRPAYILANTVDISAEKQLESAMQTSRARQRPNANHGPRSSGPLHIGQSTVLAADGFGPATGHVGKNDRRFL
jgi:PAS domain S-box-containing protein